MGTFEHWKAVHQPGEESAQRHDLRLRCHARDGRGSGSVARWLGERDCINHVHFRNVRVRKPYVDYTEVFLDEGVVNMFAVMKELVRQNIRADFTRSIRARST